MDDSNVVGATQEVATEAMDLAVTAFQLGGWNIQWKKSDLQAKSQVIHGIHGGSVRVYLFHSGY
jgi:hypothetical protein